MTSALETMAGLVMPSGVAWGVAATPEQWADAEAVLAAPGGPRRHWISRARGYSKTEDAAAMSVAVLSHDLVAGDEAWAFARDRDQARILVDRMAGFIRRTPGLSAAFKVETYQVTSLATGARLKAFEADSGSAWGLLPGWVVYDEICQHPSTPAAEGVFEAVSTSLVKHPGSRAVLITTSGDPGHWSRRVFDAAVGSPLWRVAETRGPAPWQDEAELAEEKARLPEPAWRRLFLNEWAAGEDRLLDHEDVRACVTVDGAQEWQPGGRYAVGVDLALRNDRAVVAVGHLEGDVVAIDRLDVFQPTKGLDVDLDRVEGCVMARAREYGAVSVFDPALGFQMIQRLRRMGLRVVEFKFTAQSNSARTLTLLRLIREQRLAIPDDELLIDELVNLRVRETSPGVYRHDHDASKHDDAVTAVSLVAHHLVTGRHRGARFPVPTPDGHRVTAGRLRQHLQDHGIQLPDAEGAVG